MKTVIALLAAATLGTLTTVSLTKMQSEFTQLAEPNGTLDEVNIDALNFWDISTEAIRAEDPAGWDSFLGREQTAELSAEMEVWAIIQRRAIFLRRYGYPYDG